MTIRTNTNEMQQYRNAICELKLDVINLVDELTEIKEVVDELRDQQEAMFNHIKLLVGALLANKSPETIMELLKQEVQDEQVEVIPQ